MNTKFEQYDFVINQFYLPVLINDDYSGLDDQDIDNIKSFLDSLDQIKQIEDALHYHIDYDTNINFTRCEVCKLKANCVDVRVMFAKRNVEPSKQILVG